MKASNFELQRYLDRIGFIGEPKVDMATATEMMRRQLFSVPFENIDVQKGKMVSLVPEEIVEKIINRKRGGYCYEVNGIFAMALHEIGFQYQFVAARPMVYSERRPKTHMAIIVTLNDEAWLFDLGFGSYGIRKPVPLSIINTEITQDLDTFMLSKASGDEYLLKACVEGKWENQYAFDLSAQEWIDFSLANYFNSTHPDAIFVQKLLIVLHDPNGRTVLFGDSLKTLDLGVIKKQLIRPHEQKAFIKERFNLDID